MSGWQLADNGMEAKVTNRGEVLIREAGKYPSNNDYPHFNVKLDNQGNVISFHSSESRGGSRFGEDEVIATALTYLRGEGML